VAKKKEKKKARTRAEKRGQELNDAKEVTIGRGGGVWEMGRGKNVSGTTGGSMRAMPAVQEMRPVKTTVIKKKVINS